MPDQRPVQTVDVNEASQRLAASGDVLLVDVRERHEFAMQRVPGAVLLPLSEFAATFSNLPLGRPILTMCHVGQRSLAAAEFLAHNGYPDVASVSGGIDAWQRAGLPIDRGPAAPGEGDIADS